tara:strand:+ start:8758 stop:9207 length:450 start_codon:yes stop_codon:yes gene_type:complete
MPYVRCGRCVYKGDNCEAKGKKVGCSDSVEKAKKYLTKLRMETNEGIMKITKKQLKQLIKEELEVVLTDDEAKEMFDIDVTESSNLLEADQNVTQPTAAHQRPERVDTVAEPALQRPDQKKVVGMLIDFVAALEKRIEALEGAIQSPQE